MRILDTKNPWQAGLITATAVSVMGFNALLLSQAGHAEWAFLMVFGGGWCLFSLFWANDAYNEDSGLLLAEILDENVAHLNNRLAGLEQHLQQVQTLVPDGNELSAPRLPVPQDQWV